MNLHSTVTNGGNMVQQHALFIYLSFQIQKPNVGAVGVSKGGDLALSLSTFIPEVTAGVCINGCISSVQSKLNLQDGSIEGLEFDLGRVEV